MSPISVRVNVALPAPMNAIFGRSVHICELLFLIANDVIVPGDPMQLDRIDAHTHLGRWLDPGTDWMASDLAGRCDATWAAPDVDALLDVMDAHRIAACVNLDGRWGDELEANLERYDRAHPARFATFCHVDWGAAARGDDFAAGLVAELRRSAAAGARGLKVWKTLGLGFRDAGGELLLPDDPRCAPVFAAAGELGLPVLIHTADPRPFFDPAVDGNPRLDELREHPEWSYANGGFPTHERLRRALLAVVEQHPGTCFVAAHVAASADELGWVGRALAAHPNLCIDLAAREDELGRPPRRGAPPVPRASGPRAVRDRRHPARPDRLSAGVRLPRRARAAGRRARRDLCRQRPADPGRDRKEQRCRDGLTARSRW